MKFPFKISLAICLTIATTAVLKAQNQYGDGSLVLKSELSQDWFGTNSKYEFRDSSDFELNAQNLVTRQFQKTYDVGTTTWTPYYIQLNAYDAKGNTTLYVDSFLQSADKSSNFRSTFVYKTDGNETSHMYYEWNTAKSNWEPTERATSTYNSAGNEIVDLREEYDKTTGVWVNAIRRTSTYDGSNKYLYYIKEVWDRNTNKWVNQYKILYFGNGTGTDSNVYQKYNTVTAKWENDDKYVYTHNGSNKVLTNSQFDWVNNTWQPVSKSTNTYLADGQLLTYLYEQWDNTTKALVPSYKTLYGFNSKNWEVGDSMYNWNAGTSSWEIYNRNTHTYNSKGYETLLASSRYNSGPKQWANSSRIFYRYASKQGNAINGALQNKFALFPNPAAEQFSLVSNEVITGKCSITICDSRGRIVSRITDGEPLLGSGISINVSDYNLGAGLYYVTIKTEAGSAVLPLVVK